MSISTNGSTLYIFHKQLAMSFKSITDTASIKLFMVHPALKIDLVMFWASTSNSATCIPVLVSLHWPVAYRKQVIVYSLLFGLPLLCSLNTRASLEN
jgi:hypothetical protein